MSTYVSIRDDSGRQSQSLNEADFIRRCAAHEDVDDDGGRRLRSDGRGPTDLRRIQMNLTRRHNGAECTVQWGNTTRISSNVTATLRPPPKADRPSEGVVSISVHLSPMACTSFSLGSVMTTGGAGADDNNHQQQTSGVQQQQADEMQRWLGNRILRCLERILLVGGALDTEALCVQSGSWVWVLHLSVTILDHAGNLLDAAVLSAMAALRHYRKPHVDHTPTTTQQENRNDKSNKQDEKDSGNNTKPMPQLIHSDAREPTPLPLHHTPLALSFALIHNDDDAGTTSNTSKSPSRRRRRRQHNDNVTIWIDPTDREEWVQTGCVTIAMNAHSEVCLLDFGGGCELQPEQLQSVWELAETHILPLCRMLEQTLTDADEKAQSERLERLQKQEKEQQQQQQAPHGVPFWHFDDSMQVNNDDITTKQQQDEEEKYRLQALEYNRPHAAAKVRENTTTTTNESSKNKVSKWISSNNNNNTGGNSLLAAMLQSASSAANQKESTTNKDQRTEAARSEFQQFVKTKQQENQQKQIIADTPKEKAAIDEDEDEEAPVMLQTEFAKITPKPAQKEKVETTTSIETKKKPVENKNDDDDDVDDLAKAIKSKKKKKGKKKK